MREHRNSNPPGPQRGSSLAVVGLADDQPAALLSEPRQQIPAFRCLDWCANFFFCFVLILSQAHRHTSS